MIYNSDSFLFVIRSAIEMHYEGSQFMKYLYMLVLHRFTRPCDFSWNASLCPPLINSLLRLSLLHRLWSVTF